MDGARRRFREVTATLALNKPSSILSLFALFNEPLSIRDVVKPLGLLLIGALDEEKLIRPLHTSLRDFYLPVATLATWGTSVTYSGNTVPPSPSLRGQPLSNLAL